MTINKKPIKAATVMSLLSILGAWAQAGQTGPTLSIASSPQQGKDVISVKSDRELGPGKHLTPTPIVPSSEAVITIHGLCEDPPIQQISSVKVCTTIVTREAFEKLLDSMNIMGKTLTPETRRSLAEVYVDYLAFERPATKAGLESTPRFKEIMRWWRLRTLAGLYRGNLQEQFKSPSHEEIHAYYLAHLTSYQRLTVARILIPRTPGPTDEARRLDKKAFEIAISARERTAKGDDPDAVQKDAYSSLGLTTPPITNLGTNPRSSFPKEETDELFSLESGQVSKVETEGASYVIYKVASKETLPEESAKDTISSAIAQDKYDEAVRAITESAKPEFNQDYFGPAVANTPATSLSSPHQ
jgi:hypothetical protein